MPKAPDPMPRFETEAGERAHWERENSTEHLDWSQAERVTMPNIRPASKSISLRLPVALLDRIKVAAHKRDVPYQSLIKVWLDEKAAARE